jgi:trehalose 2-sulfotransferase
VLVGKDTGYEGKFDFPRQSVPPRVTYMLASLPRSGSTWFSHLLWRTGCLGAPLEYLNFEAAGPYYFAASAPAVQQRLWQSVLHRRTSPNGVFGAKCFAGQLEALQQHNPALLTAVMATLVRRPSPRIVYFERRDRSAHAISFARASLSGVWRKEQEAEEGVTVDYSEVAIGHAEQMIEGEQDAWRRMFGELRIEPLIIWYEDALAEPDAATSRVADYLGVTLDVAAQVDVPPVEKQSATDSAAWAERYAATRARR